jgi:hypothetical protein
VKLYGVVPADASGVQGAAASDLTGPAAGDAAHAKRGEFLIAPLPMVNPTLENGLAFAVGYLYRVDGTDTTTAPSVSAIGGFKTSNGSWGGMAFQSLRLAQRNHVNLRADYAWGRDSTGLYISVAEAF